VEIERRCTQKRGFSLQCSANGRHSITASRQEEPQHFTSQIRNDSRMNPTHNALEFGNTATHWQREVCHFSVALLTRERTFMLICGLKITFVRDICISGVAHILRCFHCLQVSLWRRLYEENWYAAYEDDDPCSEELRIMTGNTDRCSRQGRKYMSCLNHPTVVFCDTQTLVGVQIDADDINLVNTAQALSGRMFVESNNSKFLISLFLVVIDALLEAQLL
jgi:hypothetical protein